MNNQLSIEELLRPRYKLIADYPGRSTTTPVGFIFISSQDEVEKHFSKYPAIFKRLEWWQERKPEEMPDYIRLNQNTVCKVRKHFTSFNRRLSFYDTATKYDYTYDVCEPATEAEFNSQPKNK